MIAHTPNMEDRLERTEAAIASGAPVIYNAACRTDGVFVEVDILARDGAWRIRGAAKVSAPGLAVPTGIVTWDAASTQHQLAALCGFTEFRAG